MTLKGWSIMLPKEKHIVTAHGQHLLGLTYFMSVPAIGWTNRWQCLVKKERDSSKILFRQPLQYYIIIYDIILSVFRTTLLIKRWLFNNGFKKSFVFLKQQLTGTFNCKSPLAEPQGCILNFPLCVSVCRLQRFWAIWIDMYFWYPTAQSERVMMERFFFFLKLCSSSLTTLSAGISANLWSPAHQSVRTAIREYVHLYIWSCQHDWEVPCAL